MTSSRMCSNPQLPAILFDRQDSGEEVWVFDVGCSGGVERHWDHFGSALRAIGFDPLVSEIERLKSTEERQGVDYEAAFVGWNGYDAAFPPELRSNYVASRSNITFDRTSAAEVARRTNQNYIQEYFNANEAVQWSDVKLEVDAYVRERGVPRVDFLKVDTDGSDINVLLGAKDTLKTTVLGASVESQFHGASHPYANVFSNIDRLMRECGFSLVDLEPYRYTRSAMPGEFLYDIPAQTIAGPVEWAESVYAKDLADPDYEAKYGFQVTRDHVLKLACFYEMFGLADCAVELLIARRNLLENELDVDGLLDALTRSFLGRQRRYADYVADVFENPGKLYPSRLLPRSSTGPVRMWKRRLKRALGTLGLRIG